MTIALVTKCRHTDKLGKTAMPTECQTIQETKQQRLVFVLNRNRAVSDEKPSLLVWKLCKNFTNILQYLGKHVSLITA